MGADLIFSANVVVPIFLLIILGYFLTRIKLWDGHFLKVANEVCFKCLLPVLLFYNVATANIFEVFNLKLIVYVCLCACLLCGLLFLIVPIFVKDKKRRGVMIQGTFRSNFLLFGVPLGLSIGGDEGAVLAAVVASFYVPVINMLSVISLYAFSEAENKNIKSAIIGIVKNPLIIGGVSGLIFSLIRNSIGFEMPAILDTTLFNIKSAATPIAFLILGGDLKFGNLLRNVKDPRVQGTMISITRVETTPDLRYTKVYVSFLQADKAEEALKGLKSAAGFLRRQLGTNLKLRYAPEINWALDDSITYGAKMLELINNLPYGNHDDEE